MKKTISTKQVTQKKATNSAVRGDIPRTTSRTKFNAWSLSVYVYWFIILFFIAATFYILGRSHGVLNNRAIDSAELTEESLRSASDYYDSSRIKLMTGNIDEALADLNTAIADGVAHTDMYVLRGEAYMMSGNYAAAENDFNRAIEMDNMNAMAYYDRSLLNTRLENYDAAMNDINSAMAARAQRHNDYLPLRDLYAKRGQLNLWMKNWDGAIADYTNSLARPEGIINPTVYAERAEAFTALGDYTSALEDYTSAIRVISEQIQGVQTAEERESLSSRAMSYFEKSAALNLNMGNIDNSVSDLNAARTIAVALSDTDSVDRIDSLLNSLAQ